MSYNYVPPPTPAGYDGNEELYRQHQQLEAEASQKRQEEIAKNLASAVPQFQPAILPPIVDTVPVTAPAKKRSLLMGVLKIIDGFGSLFGNDTKKKHTEIYGTIRDEHGIKVAERDSMGTPRDRFGNYVDVDV